MKSNVFGYSAKLALATLAVCGTLFTGCYGNDEIDTITPTPTPDPAKYYIAGTVYDGATSAAITGATITIAGATVTQDGSSFRAEVSAPGKYTVSVTKADYKDVTRDVQVITVNAGQIYVANADIAMISSSAYPASPLKSSTVKKLTVSQLTTDYAFPAETTVQEDGTIVIKKLEDFTANAGNVVISYDNYNGFITPSTATRSLDYTTIARNSIVAATGMPFAGTKFADFIKQGTTTGMTALWKVIGFNITRYFQSIDYVFDIEGTTTLTGINETGVIISLVYDTHDSHNQHGNNPNAGGGGSN